MDLIWRELASDFPTAAQLVRICVRLIATVIIASVVGVQRERSHKSAGLRTHLMVALGAAIFVLIPEEAGYTTGDISRVMQGIATGIGFLGGGVILKVDAQQRVRGLTTAAAIWLMAVIGVSCGIGRFGIAIVSVLLSWFILVALAPIDRILDGKLQMHPVIVVTDNSETK